jgi:hypothetical protein
VTVSNRLKTSVLATWTLIVTGTSVFVVWDHYATRDRLSRLDAVGGTDVYRRQRVEHLKRLKADAQRYVADPVVRAREIEALDRQIAEVSSRDASEEIGDELKIERR